MAKTRQAKGKAKPGPRCTPAAMPSAFSWASIADPVEIVRLWKEPGAIQAAFRLKSEADARMEPSKPLERALFKAWNQQLSTLREYLRANAPDLSRLLPVVNFFGPTITVTATKMAERMVEIEDGLLSRHDTRNDTRKKTRKRRLAMTKEAADCAKRYKKARKADPTIALKDVVSDHVEETGNGSVGYILRVLSDNPDQWKGDTKAT